MDFDLVYRLLAAFEKAGVEYVVFGGVTVNLHGLVRATQDLDVFIRPDVQNVERMKEALFSVFGDPCISEIDAGDLLGDYPAVRYVPPSGGFYVDILTRLGEAFTFESLASERLELEGIQVTAATPRTLFAMKKDTVRYKDRIDAAALAERFGLEERV